MHIVNDKTIRQITVYDEANVDLDRDAAAAFVMAHLGDDARSWELRECYRTNYDRVVVELEAL